MDGDMFTDRTIMVALFTIAIASSLLGVSGFVSSAFADTKKVTNQDPLSTYLSFPIHVGGQKPSSLTSQSANGSDSSDNAPPAVLRKDQSRSPTSQSANPDHSGSTTTDTNSVHKKDLKNLSKCESSAAADGKLTTTEVTDCYNQVF
jgi:hypothetical protein